MTVPFDDKKFESSLLYVQRHVKKALKRAASRCEQYKSQWIECQNWKCIHHQAELLQSNLFQLHKGVKSFFVSDWEREGQKVQLALDPLIEPSEQVRLLYRKSRKLRRGQIPLSKQSALAEALLKKLEEQLHLLSTFSTMEQLQQFCQEHHYEMQKQPPSLSLKKQTSVRLPYDQYLTQAQLQIWVGKSAKDNDRLTFQYANGADYWLHARDYPGSHVILRVKIAQLPDQESLRDASELALRFSKALDKAEVCITQVKFVKKVKGVAGKVTLSKHRVMFCAPDPIRWKRLNS